MRYSSWLYMVWTLSNQYQYSPIKSTVNLLLLMLQMQQYPLTDRMNKQRMNELMNDSVWSRSWFTCPKRVTSGAGQLWKLLLYSSTWRGEEWLTTTHIHCSIQAFIQQTMLRWNHSTRESTQKLSQLCRRWTLHGNNRTWVGGCDLCWHLDSYAWWVSECCDHYLSQWHAICLSVCRTWVVAALLA